MKYTAIVETQSGASIAPVECINKPLPFHKLGLQFTATGYGSRIPTRFVIKHGGKLRRVYCRIYSNCCTLFIGASVANGLIVQINEVTE